MKSREKIFLYEEVMLLSLKDEKGTMENGAFNQAAIGGAILSELLLSGRIEIEQEKKKRFARVANDRSLGDPLLDECLQRIRDAKKRQQLRTWVSRFANTKDLKNRVARQLCRKGVLREAEDKVLLIFKRRIFPEIDPQPEREIIARLKQAIFTTGPVDSRTVVLVAIAQSANLLKNVFEKKKLKERKERIKIISSGDAAGNATREVIQAAQAAAAMTAIMAASVATSSS
ncbi:MAG: GPP34 family phosphoprotein [Gemmatimonadales bacterium]|nr:GPP34 family phosphoprotein [Gemmatimonadales bacterium]